MGESIILAKYNNKGIPDYKGNPLIEALPPIFEFNDVFKRMCEYPDFDVEERNLTSKQRFHCIQRIRRYFQPWDIHFKLEEKLSIALMQGYISRNPLLPGYVNDLNELYEAYKSKDYQFNNINIMQSCACGFTIVGFSGMGKTSAINSILRMYPQVIIHNEYNGQPFNHYQLVYLKLDCPPDGSLKGVCTNFLQAVDEIFDENLYKKYASGSHSNVYSLVPIMTQTAKRHSLGLLIIDEVQALSAAKSGGYQKVLNFFVDLVNVIGIPVILIGTTKALGVLQSEFRQARRGSGLTGDVVWENLKKDKYWDLLIKGLFRYQWTRKQVELTDELSNVLYDKSQGIIDIAVKLYAMSQMRAISNGTEKITPSIIREVSEESLKLVEPMINALRKRDIKAIQKFDDIMPLDLDAFTVNESNKFDEILNVDTAIIDSVKNATEMSSSDIIEKVIEKLMECNIDMSTARKAVIKVLKGKRNLPDIPVIVNEALRVAFQSNITETVKPVKSKKQLRQQLNDVN